MKSVTLDGTEVAKGTCSNFKTAIKGGAKRAVQEGLLLDGKRVCRDPRLEFGGMMTF